MISGGIVETIFGDDSLQEYVALSEKNICTSSQHHNVYLGFYGEFKGYFKSECC